ncbi:digalactosyldiacylglycerol synthase 2, chloroplastic [Dorcoceras hygrometricum]|uniref:Digalactosyldiacylglycerol synthase 2, chloroplastic n=1 Tax=Dorcoceras hygrometricum TaxID=472368 RepID=A0A2Z7AFH9_9LAMI|nr:digalactosyldiacylglycerol synthase 2, chloroplastic [Dorcoceras hygrometricum]
MRSGPEQPAPESHTYTGKSVYAPIEIREINWVTYFLPKIDPADKIKGVLPYLDRPNPVEEHYLLVIQDLRDKAEFQIQGYDQWHRFRTDYRLSKILSLNTVEEFVKAENKLFSWGPNKVSELLQRRDLVWYKFMELHMRELSLERISQGQTISEPGSSGNSPVGV